MKKIISKHSFDFFTENNLTVKSELKKILNEKKISVRELANLSGISAQTLYSSFKTDDDKITLELLKKICNALNVPVLEVISGTSYSSLGDVIPPISLSSKLKLLRRNKGFTQRELSEKSSVAIASLQRYETNRTYPNEHTIKKLAVALDTDPDILTDGTIISATTSIGKNIKNIREKNKLSQKRLAKKAGINLSSLQAYEGDSPAIQPSLLRLQRIAVVLNCWITELIGTRSLAQSDGDLIFYGRSKKLISRKKLAEILEITDAELQLMEEGIISPSDEIKTEIAQKLDFSIEELFPKDKNCALVKEWPLQEISNQLTDDRNITLLEVAQRLLKEQNADEKNE